MTENELMKNEPDDRQLAEQIIRALMSAEYYTTALFEKRQKMKMSTLRCSNISREIRDLIKIVKKVHSC